ncbi:MAG: hypothetical protein UV09_C0012G0004 [Candidatus Gottesmanbacteria bacterium GW2011_GWA2_42_18]|uniref:Uncharacterized protein n=1 Tax=Candidatus Gottesmanbacteria bacterium GW2011_GWA2_42_18 TaxID=1618442 RepID=A0A0G0ZDN2_9BACT|nr:MAG: hypothetical protein UV09_C0012G0004 [Candidatus Gottesmanbacteria bacterium GW2011_GWA2_42_18]
MTRVAEPGVAPGLGDYEPPVQLYTTKTPDSMGEKGQFDLVPAVNGYIGMMILAFGDFRNIIHKINCFPEIFELEFPDYFAFFQRPIRHLF